MGGAVDWLTTTPYAHTHTPPWASFVAIIIIQLNIHPSIVFFWFLMLHTLGQVSGTCPATLPHAASPSRPHRNRSRNPHSHPRHSHLTSEITARSHHSCLRMVPGVGCRLMVLPLANELNLKWWDFSLLHAFN